MLVNRKELLRKLECVADGLARTPSVSQSDCFVFKDGKLHTFNETVACILPFDLGVTGAVSSKELLQVLKKHDKDELDVFEEEGNLIIKVPQEKTSIRMEDKIRLPLKMDSPERWRPLPQDFWEAVSFVQNCCAKKDKKQLLTCVHLSNKWVEASDRYQVARWYIDLDLVRPILIRREALKGAAGLSMTEFGESQSWAHFRNAAGLVLSCRRYLEEYPNMTSFLDVTGKTLKLPKELDGALSRASVFADTDDLGFVRVDLRRDKLKITGTGANGKHRAVRDCSFDGEEMSFGANPKILSEIGKKTDTAVLSKGRMKFSSDKWVFVAVTANVDEE